MPSDAAVKAPLQHCPDVPFLAMRDALEAAARTDAALICPKCGSQRCGHGMEPLTRERFAELHPPRPAGSPEPLQEGRG